MKRTMAAMLAVVMMLSVSGNQVYASGGSTEMTAESAVVNEVESLPEDPEYFKYVESQNQDAEVQLYNARSTGYQHDSRFANCTIRYGIDVSYYQNNAGTIDWNAVKASGVEFVFIRVAYRGYGSSGTLVVDPKAEENLKGASAAGLKIGVYIFSQATNAAEAAEEARYAIEQIKGYNVTMPIVMDFEYASNKQGLTGRLYNAHLTREQATETVNAFGAAVRAAGYEPMIYANKDMLENNLNAANIPYKIWLAHYTNKTSYRGNYEFWQHTSGGSIPGISGNVDCNFWYDGVPATYTQTIADGTYRIESAVGTDRVLDIADSSKENGGNLQLWSRDDSRAQSFKVTYVGDGKYSLMSVTSEKYVDVEGGATGDGTNILQWDWNGAGNQKWYIQDAGDGYYYIRSSVSEKCIDVENGNSDNGTNVIMWSHNGGAGQKFRFIEAAAQPGGEEPEQTPGQNPEQTPGQEPEESPGQTPELTPGQTPEQTGHNGWYVKDGKKYWYDYGVMARDKEVYDPETKAWYWFDADGTMATDKDVFIPTKADRSEGKWVRYDANGGMVKGEDYRYGGWYWFDPITGEMIKGFVFIPEVGTDGKWVYYDEITGQMHHGESCINGNWYYFDDWTGKMVKGEYERNGNWYYYDEITGIMAHGWTTLPDGRRVYYDDVTGVRR